MDKTTTHWLYAEIATAAELHSLYWLRQPPVEMVVPDPDTPLSVVVNNVLQVVLSRLNSERDPCWWPRVRELVCLSFDFQKMLTAAITPAVVGKKAEESDSFRIYEGQQRTLALAWVARQVVS